MRHLEDVVIAKRMPGNLIELFLPLDEANYGNIICWGYLMSYPLGEYPTTSAPMYMSEATLGYFHTGKKPDNADLRVNALIKRYEREVQAWSCLHQDVQLVTRIAFKDTQKFKQERWSR